MGIEATALKCFKSYQSEVNDVFFSNWTSNELHIDLGFVQKVNDTAVVFLVKNWQDVFQTVNTVSLQ